jgi:ankyrin repeat protein
MARNDLEEDLIIIIDEDNVEQFCNTINSFENWENYVLTDEPDYFIHYSLKSKALKIVDYIINHTDFNINLKNGPGFTPLQLAIFENHCAIVSSLINKFWSELQFSKTNDGNTELHLWLNNSCEKCLKEMYKLLIRNTNATILLDKNNFQNNALHQAVIDNNLTAFKELKLYFGFDITDEGENGNNILHLATIYSDWVYLY